MTEFLPTSESEPTEISPVDADLNEIENGTYSIKEQAYMTRQIVEDMDNFSSPLYRRSYEPFAIMRADGNGPRHFLLPDIPDSRGSRDGIREWYEGQSWPHEYKATHNRIFIKVGQGHMWTSAKAAKPYLTVATSECSTLIGASPESLTVAHISFSENIEIEAAIEHMLASGITINNIHAVASVGEYQKQRGVGQFRSRSWHVDHYIALGLNPANITTFEHYPGEQAGLRHGMTGVLVTPAFIFSYSYDTQRVPGGIMGVTEERSGDYYEEKVTAL